MAATLFRRPASPCAVNPSSFQIDLPDTVLARARRGELAALESIYRSFERPAYTLALRITAHREDAREVVHDAMLRMFERIAQFRADAPFWAWLRQIVANTALMHLRSSKRRDATETDWPETQDCFVSEAPEPIRAVEAAELDVALATLPATTRSVIWLYCVEGYSHAEIAALMEQTVSFSKSQLSRGLARLRRHFQIQEVSHA